MRKFLSYAFKISAIGLAISFAFLFILTWAMDSSISLGFACFFGFVNLVCMLLLKKIGSVDEIAYLSSDIRSHEAGGSHDASHEEFHDSHH